MKECGCSKRNGRKEVSWMGRQGLSDKARKWYTEQILNVLRGQEHGVTTAEIIFSLKKLSQQRYPLQKGRITSLLKEMRNYGLIRGERPEGSHVVLWELNGKPK